MAELLLSVALLFGAGRIAPHARGFEKMRLETQTVRVGEWLGDVPPDWDFDAFYRRHLEGCGHRRDYFNEAVQHYRTMEAALKRGATVYATGSGGFTHLVYSCGLYDGWAFWEPRPCFSYQGPIPGEHKGEFYHLIGVRVEEPESRPSEGTSKP